MIKAKKRALFVIGIIIAVFILAILIRMLPFIQTAMILQKAETAKKVTYEGDIHLNRDAFSDKEKDFLDILTQLLAVDEEDLLNLHLTGEFSEEYMIVDIYCQGFDSPVTEIYYSEEEKTINVKMLYDTITTNLSDELWILEIILPKWQFTNDYITFEQLEEAFGVDMEALFSIETWKDQENRSIWEYVVLLSKTDVEKDSEKNNWFKGNYQGYSIQFCAAEENHIVEIMIKGDAKKEVLKIDQFRVQAFFLPNPNVSN